MKVLGIESSCDETAAAVVEDGRVILSSEVASQVDIHSMYGGVVPELASRNHLRAVVPVVRAALDNAGVAATDLDGIAATQGPGLVGALLVGFSFAKAYAHSLGLPWVGVNHLIGHVHSVHLESDPPEYPFVALLASGGHTIVYLVRGPLETEVLGRTRDDAAGEAYDKVAKALGLGYPGGRVIDDMATAGDPERIRFPRTWLDKDAFDFSFSGIKTAVKRYIETHPDTWRDEVTDIVASFQEAVVEVLAYKCVWAAERTGCERIALVGGVSANRRLREAVRELALPRGMRVWAPALWLCGDNAAMIAAAGTHLLERGERAGLGLDVFSRIPS
ncbi:MAG: tRNA (adenosine(37)-N6)-threonylcarbamoyltransferase complex transferase subunit TsaD [Desulfatibacillaceae bacterium]